MNKIKILFFLPNLNGGGAEKVTVNILRKLNKDKYDLHLVLTEKKGQYLDLIPNYVQIHDLKVSKTVFSILKLRHKILEIRPDIVFSTLFRTHVVLNFALLGMKNKPKVILRSPNSPKLIIENKQISSFMKMMLEKAYRDADLIIAQTPEMKNEIIKYHHIEENKITVLLNPIDTDLIDEKIKDIQNPFDKEYVNVVAAGRLTHQKGFDVLIEAFKEVIENNNNFRLYIIGDGDDKSKLENLIEKYNLGKYITLLGFQDNPYKYFHYSDLYVLSSRWEGLPNTVLENLYLKKPIIATKCIPFMDHLIQDGKNGILVLPEDSKTLFSAILNYKIINTEYKTIEFNSNNINDIFKKKESSSV